MSDGVEKVHKLITIGIPCYNEQDNIKAMYAAIVEQIDKLPQYDFEIIFADNNSSDSTQDLMREIAQNDKRVKIILNQTNFGPNRSSVNCYRNSSGDAYIGIPCDFQEPPEMIPQFIRGWENGYDIVWGQKVQSEENRIKYLLRKIYHKIIRLMSDYSQPEQITGFGLMGRNVIDTLLYTQLQDPYYNATNLVFEYGFNVMLIPYKQNRRARGKSSYNMSRHFDFAITSLCNTSTKPLHLITLLGCMLSVLCLIISIVYFVYKIVNWDNFSVGMAPIVVGFFLISGVQLMCIGIIGEYISVVIRRVTRRPLVIEKEKINFSSEEEKAKDENRNW